MITLRTSRERYHVQRRGWDAWLTFPARAGRGPSAGGLEALLALNEGRLLPRAVIPHPSANGEQVLTYVFEGSLACQDSTGASTVLCAGEFQCRTAVRGIRHRESNASSSVSALVFQVSLQSCPAGLSGMHTRTEAKRFLVAQRRGLLRMVASADGQKGSLHIQSNARVYSAILEPGRHLAHAIASRSSVWIHIVAGRVRMGAVSLTTGDGAGITGEHAVSLIAEDESEILLIDLGRPHPEPSTNGFEP